MLHPIAALVCCGLCFAQARATNFCTIIPFIQVDDLILVEVTIDGKTGNFIVDTGAPTLFLNKKYFKGRIENKEEQSWDINGAVSFSEVYYTKKLQIQTFEKKKMAARVIDLSHQEKAKNTVIYGVLGYDIFKNMELVFDFDKKELSLYKLDKKGNRLWKNDHSFDYPTDSFTLNMSRHIPFLVAFIDGKRLRLGIDSGAEMNILERDVFKNQSYLLDYQQPVLVNGFSNRKKQVRTAALSNLEVEDATFKRMNFALMDLSLLQGHRGVKLDGMLGSNFLKSCRMSINYRKKKFYLWQTENQQLAIRKVDAFR